MAALPAFLALGPGLRRDDGVIPLSPCGRGRGPWPWREHGDRQAGVDAVARDGLAIGAGDGIGQPVERLFGEAVGEDVAGDARRRVPSGGKGVIAVAKLAREGQTIARQVGPGVRPGMTVGSTRLLSTRHPGLDPGPPFSKLGAWSASLLSICSPAFFTGRCTSG